LELDVLIALEIGLNVGDLCSAVRTCFPVLEQIEEQQYYDKNGSIVFTTDKSLSGVVLPRKAGDSSDGWDEIFASGSVVARRVLIDDTTPEGPVERTIIYEAPFDRCDRVEDYKTAWAFFEKWGIS
jgi:hypothetical protein